MEKRDAQGRLHCIDGPAVTSDNGYQAWWLNGKLHRSNGPAVIHPSGFEEFWFDGQRFTKRD